MAKHIIVGHCPKCGAPIFAPSDDGHTASEAKAEFTCQCRNAVTVKPYERTPWYPQPYITW